MRDMNPRSACRRTPTLMEIHMTTYKPTGEKPDEFNLYLQERMAALGLDPKTIAENTGIALPTVLTHLNLPGKPIKAQSIQFHSIASKSILFTHHHIDEERRTHQGSENAHRQLGVGNQTAGNGIYPKHEQSAR